MANSNKRTALRRARQEKRRAALGQDFMRKHPLVSHMHIIFGHSLEICHAEIVKIGNQLSKRQQRAQQKLNRMAVERRKCAEAYKLAERERLEREKANPMLEKDTFSALS